jgi:anti-sigma28 factor (negative regulator of flagellin synthesis)
MEQTKFIKNLRTTLADLKANGQDTVDIAALVTHLDAQPSNASQSIELQKIETQRALAQLDVQTKHRIEMFKAVIESGREALNALVLINGGAVIALLGFMGGTVSKGLPQALGLNLTIPLLQFGLGVLTGAIAFATRYLSQAFYSAPRKRTGDAFKYVAILFAFTGYGLFGWGIYGAYRAFSIQFAL